MQCLVVLSNSIKDRFDPVYHRNIYLVNNTDKKYPLVTLSSLLKKDPQYGANERAIDGNSKLDVRYIRITDIDEFGNLKNDEWKTAKKVDSKYLLEENDILFARSGATAGKTFIYKKQIGKAIFAGYLIRFKIDEKKINPDYVFYYTHSERYATWIKSIQRPSGQPNINADEYKSFQIPVPPIKVQNKIVKIMRSAYKDKEQKEIESEQAVKSAVPTVFKKLAIKLSTTKQKFPKIFIVKNNSLTGNRIDPCFHSPESRPINELTHLPIQKLKDLALSIKSGITPLAKSRAYTTASIGIPFIRSGDLTEDNTIDYQKILYIRKEIHKRKMISSSLEKDDILIAIVGATIGKISIFTDDIESNINQAIARIRLDKNKVNPWYVLYYLRTVGQYELNRIKRPVARANINLEEIGNMPIVLPSQKIRTEIIRIMKSSYNIKKQKRQEVKHVLDLSKHAVHKILN